ERMCSSASPSSGRSRDGTNWTPKKRNAERPSLKISTSRSMPRSEPASARTFTPSRCVSKREAKATARSSTNHGAVFVMLAPSHEIRFRQHHVPTCPELLHFLPEACEVIAVELVPGWESTDTSLSGLVHRENVSHLLRFIDPDDVSGHRGGNHPLDVA